MSSRGNLVSDIPTGIPIKYKRSFVKECEWRQNSTGSQSCETVQFSKLELWNKLKSLSCLCGLKRSSNFLLNNKEELKEWSNPYSEQQPICESPETVLHCCPADLRKMNLLASVMVLLILE